MTRSSLGTIVGLTLAITPSLGVAQVPPAQGSENPPPPQPASPPPPQPATAGVAVPVAPAAPAEGGEEIGEATVVGSSARALQRLPGATSVLSERELQRTQPLNANEALRRVPGVYVRDEEGQGLRPNISIRGLDPTRSRRVLVLEDGVPVALAPYSEPEMYYHPPIERMARVEVVRGAASILYGPQTIGGVINYVTPSIPDRFRLSFRTSFGDRGLFIGQATAADRIGDVGYVVNVLRRQGDGVRGMSFEATDVFGKVVMRLGARSELLVRLGVYNELSHSTYLGLTQPMFEQDPTQPTTPNDLFDVRRYSAAVVHTWRPTLGTELRTQVYGYTTERDWTRQIYDRDPVAGITYQRVIGDTSIPRGAVYLRNQAGTNAREYTIWGIEPRLRTRFRTGPVAHELDLGMRLHGEDMHLQRLIGLTATDRTGSMFSDDVRQGTALAFYAQDRIGFLRGRLEVIPGVRVENFWYDREIRREEGVAVNRTGTGHDGAVIPGLSVRWLNPRFALFAGGHVGYAPPRIAAAITAMGTDRMLLAERSLNGEVGGRVSIQQLRAEATAFWTEFENEIITVGGNESEFANGGSTRHRGFELGIDYDLARALHWGWSLYGAVRYTFVDARLIRSATADDASLQGNRVPYAVPHTANVSVGFEVPWGLSGQATMAYAASHFTDTENTVEPTPDGVIGVIPGFFNYDVSLRYTHRRSGFGIGIAVKSLQGYLTDANGRPRVYIASRQPDGIMPGGFGQTMVTLRYDR